MLSWLVCFETILWMVDKEYYASHILRRVTKDKRAECAKYVRRDPPYEIRLLILDGRIAKSLPWIYYNVDRKTVRLLGTYKQKCMSPTSATSGRAQ